MGVLLHKWQNYKGDNRSSILFAKQAHHFRKKEDSNASQKTKTEIQVFWEHRTVAVRAARVAHQTFACDLNDDSLVGTGLREKGLLDACPSVKKICPILGLRTAA